MKHTQYFPDTLFTIWKKCSYKKTSADNNSQINAKSQHSSNIYTTRYTKSEFI